MQFDPPLKQPLASAGAINDSSQSADLNPNEPTSFTLSTTTKVRCYGGLLCCGIFTLGGGAVGCLLTKGSTGLIGGVAGPICGGCGCYICDCGASTSPSVAPVKPCMGFDRK